MCVWSVCTPYLPAHRTWGYKFKQHLLLKISGAVRAQMCHSISSPLWHYKILLMEEGWRPGIPRVHGNTAAVRSCLKIATVKAVEKELRIGFSNTVREIGL